MTTALVQDTPELVFSLATDGNIYAMHQTLESIVGPRVETGYLWSLRRFASDSVCVVRVPTTFPRPHLVTEDRWLFSLHGLVKQKDRLTGRRRSYRRDDVERRLSWLRRRGEDHGFSLAIASVRVRREPIERPGAGFWLDVSEFSGVLVVEEPEKVVQALTTGVGGGRAWGLGMLRLLKRKEGPGHA